MATYEAADIFDKKGFISDVENAIEQIVLHPSDFEVFGGEGYEYYMMDVSPGSAGNYQAQEILSTFNVPLEDILTEEEMKELDANPDMDPEEAIRNAEFAWEAVDDVADDIASELNGWVNEAGLPCSVYFGNLEADGSFGLFCHMSEEEVEDYLDEQEEGEDEYGRTAKDIRANKRFMQDQPTLPLEEEE